MTDKLQVVGERRSVGYRGRSFWVKCAARDSIVDHPNVNPFLLVKGFTIPYMNEKNAAMVVLCQFIAISNLILKLIAFVALRIWWDGDLKRSKNKQTPNSQVLLRFAQCCRLVLYWCTTPWCLLGFFGMATRKTPRDTNTNTNITTQHTATQRDHPSPHQHTSQWTPCRTTVRPCLPSCLLSLLSPFFLSGVHVRLFVRLRKKEEKRKTENFQTCFCVCVFEWTENLDRRPPNSSLDITRYATLAQFSLKSTNRLISVVWCALHV